jgi:hypothetical protein
VGAKAGLLALDGFDDGGEAALEVNGEKGDRRKRGQNYFNLLGISVPINKSAPVSWSLVPVSWSL